jgi:quercetin dioxygenase-like cupin family protein
LSRLESGKRRLALDHLPRLAAALSVSTDDLLRAPENDDPRVRGGSQTHNGITYWPLTKQAEGGLLAFKIRISARRRNPPEELPVHEGQEWMYVLSGQLRLILGERDFTVKPGEAVEFSTWTPHWFGVLDGPVEAITIFGVHGERLHLHG